MDSTTSVKKKNIIINTAIHSGRRNREDLNSFNRLKIYISIYQKILSIEAKHVDAVQLPHFSSFNS